MVTKERKHTKYYNAVCAKIKAIPGREVKEELYRLNAFLNNDGQPIMHAAIYRTYEQFESGGQRTLAYTGVLTKGPDLDSDDRTELDPTGYATGSLELALIERAYDEATEPITRLRV